MNRFTLLALGGLTAVPCVSSAIQPQRYVAIDLGRAPGYGYRTAANSINSDGVVVGSVQGGANVVAFQWTRQGGFQLLPQPPGGGAVNVAMDINDTGEIVGFAQTGSVDRSWIYRGGVYTVLGTPPGASGARAIALNNLGEVVGITLTPSGYDSFYWSDATGSVDIMPSAAEFYDINDAGLVCGGRDFSTGGGVKIWNIRTGESTGYGTLLADHYGLGRGLNEQGAVVGYSTDVQESEQLHHGLYMASGQPMSAIPGIPSNSSGARSINEQGIVVGNGFTASGSNGNAWLWRSDSGGVLLHDQLVNKAEFSGLSGANAINDRGEIVCGAIRTSGADPFRRSVLLVPMLPGDMNCDGAIDFFDIDPFVLALFDPAAHDSTYPACDINNADLNEDSNVDFFDIDPFLARLFG